MPKRYYHSNQTSGASGRLTMKARAMTLTVMDGDKLARPVNTGAVKQYFVKNKRSISRKPKKAD